MAAVRPQYASTSLYVGDLAPEVTETILYEFFNSVGPVASIRVCRDSGSRRSLGYAYVNYHSITDAERALDTLNYTCIKGSPCRIMWSQRDPTVRKSNSGNLFVKNLDKGVDNRALHDTFSLFGNILSCKVVTDENGKSRGYGFVHFENDEAANAAVERVNGMKIGTKEVFVGPFHKRSERPSGKMEHFTNLYIRSFPSTWTESQLKNIFGQFGEVTSVWLSSDKQNRPFACVNLADVAAAKAAVIELHGKKVDASGVLPDQDVKDEDTAATEATSAKATDSADDGKKDSESEVFVLYVDRAQDKAERSSTMKQKFDSKAQQFRSKYDGVNLYIKNLSDKVDDAGLRAMFEQFGTITSAKVMRDEDGHSKGFGFVCFTSAEEATKAMAEMHLKVHDAKPLYVGLAEQKERRHARLQHHFRGSSRAAVSGGPAMASGFGAPAGAIPFFNPGMMPTQPTAAPGQPPMLWQNAGGFPQASMVWKTPFVQGGMATMPPMFPQQSGQPAFRGMPQQQQRSMRAVDARAAPGVPVVPTNNSAIQKQVLGEQLFPLVSKYQPQLAGKITGMMLDMDESELLVLIQSEAELKAKIEEALRVLEQASQHP